MKPGNPEVVDIMVSQTCQHVPIAVIVINSVIHYACAAHILTPTLQYYWYITIFDRVYLYCCGSASDETSYVYSRIHPYNGAIRRFEETPSSFPHDDVELRKFRVVIAVAMATVRIRSDSL